MTWQLGSVLPVWVFSAIGAVIIGVVVPHDDHVTWLAIVLAAAVIVTFAIQLALQRTEGFVVRAMASIGVSVVILALASAVLAFVG